MPGQVTGTIGDQDVRLDNAATESTLALLVTAIDKLASKNGKNGKDFKLQELYNKRLEETNQKKEEEAEKLDALNKELTKSKEKWQKFGQDMSAIIGSVFSNTTVGLNQLASVFDNMGPLGQVAGALTRVVNQNVEVFRQLSASGIDLGNSIFEAQRAAANAGLPLDVFAKVVTANSESLAQLGGSASEGVRRFTEISASMKKSGFSQSLAKLGYTMEEAAEFTTSYMAQTSRLGLAQRMSNEELTAGAQEYLLELDKLSRVTGMSRKEADEALKKQSIDKGINALYASMKDGGADLKKTFAAIGSVDKDMEQAYKELVKTNGIPFTENAKAIARNNPQLVELAKRQRAGAASFDDVAAGLRNMNTSVSESEQNLTGIADVRGKNMVFWDKVTGQAFKNFGANINEVNKEQKEALESQQKAVAGADRAFTDLANNIKVILMPIVEVVSFALGGIAQAVTWVMDKFTKVGTFLENTLGESAFNELKKYTSYFLSALVVLGAAMMAKSKFSAMTGAADALGGKGGGMLGKGVGAAGSAAGKGAQGLGEGVGKGVGGMLGGLADGLSKLGNPKVLLGVVALAGIGATMWITAKSLQEFANVSWEDMGKGFVALGGLGVLGAILSLAAVPIAIGAGVIALLGASLLPLAAAIAITAPHLDTISEKIAKLAEIDGDSLEGMGDALGSLGVGLAKLGAGNIMDAVGSFFGGDITDKLVKFGMAAPGIMALSVAMKDLDFSRLDASKVSFENLDVGAKRAQRLADQLGAVKAQMDKIQSPTLVESLKGAFDSLSTKITTALTPAEDTKVPGKRSQESLLSDLGKKLDQLNTQVAELVDVQSRTAPDIRKTAKNTRNIG